MLRKFLARQLPDLTYLHDASARKCASFIALIISAYLSRERQQQEKKDTPGSPHTNLKTHISPEPHAPALGQTYYPLHQRRDLLPQTPIQGSWKDAWLHILSRLLKSLEKSTWLLWGGEAEMSLHD